MTRPSLTLGPYTLQSPLGQGGMAEVWRGRHVASGTDVAIKIVYGEAARGSHFQESFRNEVRATAGLDHPNIVRLFDSGTLPELLHLPRGDALQAGLPYLVMELIDGVSLREVQWSWSWPSLRLFLMVLLDALAHAHARGVIHLDLKPENILIPSEGGLERLALTDFGIAQALDRREITDAIGKRQLMARGQRLLTGGIVGTPLYMAPEQFLGEWRGYGPWTDLYSLGCLAYELAAGHPPFQQETVVLLADAHFQQPVPPLTPRFPVPTGFEAWLLCLLEKAPQARFQRAADAAWMLEQLAPAPDGPGPGQGAVVASARLEPESAEHPTETFSQPAALTWDRSADRAGPPGSPTGSPPESRPPGGAVGSLAPAALSPPPPLQISLPPLPLSWQCTSRHLPFPMLQDVGLELYGLRQVPMVDREVEREEVWSALHEVITGGTVRAVILRGPVGSGKSRLAEWMAERAHELGAAEVLIAEHGPIASSQDGLPGMVARFLRCTGLDPVQARERVRTALELRGVGDPYEWEALTRFIEPVLEQGSAEERRQRGRIQFLNETTERYGALRRYLERLSDARPVLLWLDDVQWGGEAIRFAIHLLRSQSIRKSRILVLLTVQEEALNERLLEASDLEHLSRLPHVRRLEVALLGQPDHRMLVRELLGLEPGLAARVVRRTAGNPLFAIQLVGDWVQRRALEASPQGFRLRAGLGSILPDNIHQVWRTRLERALQGQPSEAGAALELAAALGQRVRTDEWRDVCRLAGVLLPPSLLETLLAHHLVRPLQGLEALSELRLHTFTFVHGMLRESLERAAREQGRWIPAHRACARMCLERYGAADWNYAERRGRHLLEAREWPEAAELLLTAVELRRSQNAYEEAFELLSLREGILTELRLAPTSSEWARGKLQRAKILLEIRRIEGVERELRALRTCLAEDSESPLNAALTRLEGDVTRYQGLYGRAQHLYQRALPLTRRHHLPSEEAQCLRGLANVAWEQHDIALAEALYHQAQQIYRAQGDDYRLSASMAFLGHMAQQTGRPQDARRWFEAGARLARQHGYRSCLADILRGLGRLALHHDHDPTQALEHLEEARRMLEEVGGHYSLPDCINDLGEVARAAGNLERAEQLYRDSIRLARDTGSGNWITPMLNLCTVLLIRAQFAEAAELLREQEEPVLMSGRKRLLGGYYVALALSLAGTGDWDSYDRKIETARYHLLGGRTTDDEDRLLLVRLQELLERTPGQEERRERLRSLLEALPPPTAEV